MRRILVTGGLVLSVVLGASGCGGNDNSAGAASHKAAASTGATASPSSKPTDSADVQSESRTPPAGQPGNPCDITKSGLVFDSAYGGKWTMVSPDNPPESGTYKKRTCIFKGEVPGAYDGTPGHVVPVTVSVVTYIDDIDGTLFKQLVEKAKSDNAFLLAQPDVDGTAGDGAFYDGDPGKVHTSLTSRGELDPVLIVQIVPESDRYGVFVNDVNHAASLVDDMRAILDIMAP